MKHGFFDRYSRQESPVHRLSAGVKVAGAFLVVVVSVAFRYWTLHLFLFALLCSVLALSRVPVRFVATRLLLFEPMVLGISALSLFRPDGLTLFLQVVLRTNLSLLAMILLSSTTPFGDLLRILRRLKTPPLFVTVLALMYRYIFVIVDEGERLSRARESRTFMPGRRVAWRIRAAVISQLLLRSTERAERIHAAMVARGWE
jgi:cobalt/nickel transport system permease protein